jgi:hypothetical protein
MFMLLRCKGGCCTSGAGSRPRDSGCRSESSIPCGHRRFGGVALVSHEDGCARGHMQTGHLPGSEGKPDKAEAVRRNEGCESSCTPHRHWNRLGPAGIEGFRPDALKGGNLGALPMERPAVSGGDSIGRQRGMHERQETVAGSKSAPCGSALWRHQTTASGLAAWIRSWAVCNSKVTRVVTSGE